MRSGEDDVGGVIYLMRKNGEQLIEMSEHGYDTEDLQQGYLVDHPDLLAGDQINEAEPRRWLLIIARDGVPSEKAVVTDGRQTTCSWIKMRS
jgi:hypothetical protein